MHLKSCFSLIKKKKKSVCDCHIFALSLETVCVLCLVRTYCTFANKVWNNESCRLIFGRNLHEYPNVQFPAFFPMATFALTSGFTVLVNTSTCTQSSTHPPKPKCRSEFLSALGLFFCLHPLFYTIFTLLPFSLLASSHCQTLWLCGLVGKGSFSRSLCSSLSGIGAVLGLCVWGRHTNTLTRLPSHARCRLGRGLRHSQVVTSGESVYIRGAPGNTGWPVPFGGLVEGKEGSFPLFLSL